MLKKICLPRKRVDGSASYFNICSSSLVYLMLICLSGHCSVGVWLTYHCFRQAPYVAIFEVFLVKRMPVMLIALIFCWTSSEFRISVSLIRMVGWSYRLICLMVQVLCQNTE